MIDKCRSCLDLFDSHYVSEITESIVVTERNPDGAGEAVFRTDKPCVLIKPDRKRPPLWSLIQKKCADGAFFLFDKDKDEAHLHIVELKSKIKLATWATVVGQFEGMFLTALAVARLLHVHDVARVTCYLVAKEDRITNKSDTPSPILLKNPVGQTTTFGRKESWDKEVIELPLSVKATLVKGWKNDKGVADFGLI